MRLLCFLRQALTLWLWHGIAKHRLGHRLQEDIKTRNVAKAGERERRGERAAQEMCKVLLLQVPLGKAAYIPPGPCGQLPAWFDARRRDPPPLPHPMPAAAAGHLRGVSAEAESGPAGMCMPVAGLRMANVVCIR